jgi:hypothetical protein
MQTTGVEALPLHDAVLKSVQVDWEMKRCSFEVAAFTQCGTDAGPRVLAFEGVRSVTIPHDEPWGPSSCINQFHAAGDQFRIEMQSGDVIELTAASFIFAAL